MIKIKTNSLIKKIKFLLYVLYLNDSLHTVNNNTEFFGGELKDKVHLVI